MDEKLHNLGGSIELSGFRDIDSSSMAVVNKNVSNHAKRIEELAKKMGKLHITLKPIHEREKSEKYEVHATVVINGKIYASEMVDRNLFVAVDTVLNKLTNELD